MLPPSEQPHSSSTTAAAAPEHQPKEPEQLATSVVEPEPEDLTEHSQEITGENGCVREHVEDDCQGDKDKPGAQVPSPKEEEDEGVPEKSGASEMNSISGEKAELEGGANSESVASTAVKKEVEVGGPSTVESEVGEDPTRKGDEDVDVSEHQKTCDGIENSELKENDGGDLRKCEQVEASQVNHEDLLKLDEGEEEEPSPSRSQNTVAEEGIVGATFVDFEDGEVGTGRDDDEEDEGILLMGNPDLQKIREEQVRKWLIFEQENPVAEGSLTASMEVDSLAAGATTGQGNGTEEDDFEDGREDGGDAPDGTPRRVRFLTDQEGNLLISVFMTNTPTGATPLSEEPSLLSNGGAAVDEDIDVAVRLLQQQSPSLVVSPPSLENNGGEEQKVREVDDEEELVDSIEPSAPPLEVTSGSEDEDEPPSIVLIAPLHPKEPPSEKPPAPPTTSGDDSANESSDETLSVSSCNSMIEILPSNEQSRVAITLDVVDRKEEVIDNSCCPDQERVLIKNDETEESRVRVGAVGVTPCFQLGVMGNHHDPSAASTQSEENEEDPTSGSSQPASLIIHEVEERNEGMILNRGDEEENPGLSAHPEIKVPNVDENNNVVEDSILEEDEDDDQENGLVASEVENNSASATATTNTSAEDPPQFNPEIGEQVMPELRRSTSSSSGEVEEDIERSGIPAPPVRMQVKRDGHLLLSPSRPEDDQESEMVSLCIQEEHISAVALTIAKWESMSAKAQSTENLSNVGTVASPPNGVSPISSHAPVTKSASSPCPKTSFAGILGATSPQQLLKPAQSHHPVRPIQSVAPVQGSSPPPPQQQVNRLVIHGTNSPVSNEPLVVTKAAGWSCWGNKVISNKDAPSANLSAPCGGGPLTQNMQQEGGAPSDDIIYAQPNHQAGSTMTSITNPSAILKSYPKPLSRGEIVNWLREGEIHRAGLLLNYAQSHHHAPLPGHHSGNHLLTPVLVSWFFGLISRQQAERYLQGQPSGTFLVRISTRIWGYTLSYQASSGRTKHFLISAINPAVPATLEIGPPDAALPPQSSKQQRMSPFLPQGRYAFIGTNMTPYGTLVSLIRHHSHAPITKLGGEKLLNPCPGGPQVAGLETLFQKSAAAAAAAPAPPSASSNNNIMISSA